MMITYLFLFTIACTLAESPIVFEKTVFQTESPDREKIIDSVEQKDVHIEPHNIEVNKENIGISSSITITNGITTDMLAYKHWIGTYSPDSFNISINGNELKEGEHITLTGISVVDISYSYSFRKNKYTGSKTVSYQLNENITHFTLTFSWNDEPKVLLDNATLINKI